MIFLVPLTAAPQEFQIGLNGVNYILTLKWNDSFDGGWEFDLSYSDTNEQIIGSAPFIAGADILDGLGYLGIGGNLYVYTDGNPDEVPTYTNLGIDSNLYFATPDE